MTEKRAWEDPAVTGINKEAGHATLLPFADEASALSGERDLSPYFALLNGEWEFFQSPNVATAPVGFEQPDFDTTGWDRISVPGNWQLEGDYDIPIYVNVQYPFPLDDELTIPVEDNPTGCYRRDFTIPATWDGRQVFLTFEGVDSAFHLWVNGQAVGFSKESRLTAEFNITSYLKAGVNTLAARVYRWSDGSLLEDQDFWRLAGIYRDVYLWSAPAVHLRDFYARTEFDSELQDAILSVQAHLTNYERFDVEGYTLRAKLFAPETGALIFDKQIKFALDGGGETQLEMKETVQRPAQWSDESPYRYTLLLEVLDPTGRIVEIERTAVGFRQVAIVGGELRLNGVPIKFKGVNRHEHHPRTGHSVSVESMIEDIVLMKRFNVNAVRTCHYPDDPRWYDLCDQYGILLMDEANIESHGVWDRLAKDAAWEAAFVDRGVRMVLRDRNHPSIISWSLGNESGYGPNHDRMAEAMRALDDTRPIHYHPADESPTVDMISYMYPTVAHIIESAQRTDDTRPIVMCEYAHAMGNSNGNMREYWDAVRSHPRLIGGFIWDWVDQGLERWSGDGVRWYAYGGDYGDFPNDGPFCINGLIWPDRREHPALWEYKKILEPVVIEAVDISRGDVRLTNRYEFLSLAGLSVAWRLRSEGVTLQAGAVNAPAVLPGESAMVRLPYRTPLAVPAAEYWLEVSLRLKANELWAEAGHEVAWEQFPLPLLSEAPWTRHAEEMAPLTVDEDEMRVTIHGADFTLAFDKSAGAPVEFVAAGNRLLNDTVKANFWRAPTDNDDNTWGDQKMALRWREAGLDRLVESPQSIEVIKVCDSAALVKIVNRIAPKPYETPHKSHRWTETLAGMAQLAGMAFSTQGIRETAALFEVNLDGVVNAREKLAAALVNGVAAKQDVPRLAKILFDLFEHVPANAQFPADVRESALAQLAQAAQVSGAAFEASFIVQFNAEIEAAYTYTVFGSGDVAVEATFTPTGDLPALPRAGLLLSVPQGYENFVYNGRGPHESYADRKESTRVDVFHQTVDEQHTPYVRPQENGNKIDVRWAALTSDTGAGLLAVADALINTSAHHYTPQDLTEAQHQHELKARADTSWTLDVAQGGLGNGSCGPGVLPAYVLKAEPLTLKLTLHPLRAGEQPASAAKVMRIL